jgi:hypothetical protein
MLRLLCYVFGVETATVALLTGEAIYITGACGALPVCVCPDRYVYDSGGSVTQQQTSWHGGGAGFELGYGCGTVSSRPSFVQGRWRLDVL